MSIPGLGKLPIKATSGPTLSYVTLHEGWEWRFQVDHDNPVTVRVLNGLAELDGTELAQNKRYQLRGTRSKILTFHGCQLEVEGACERQSVAELSPVANPATTSYLNLSSMLDSLRKEAARATNATGPRIMLVGPNGVGKTTLARTLTAYAVKLGSQPIVVNMDPREGMLSLPGTLSAACFATMLDVEAEGMGGWGTTPTSGPSTVPPKLPIVYQYGHQHATHDLKLYKELASKLAGAVTGRLGENVETKASGLIIDTPGVSLAPGKLGDAEADMLVHIADEFSVNMIVVLGSEAIETALKKRFLGAKTTLGDWVGVVGLEKSDGVVGNDEAWLVACQHAAIKDYFFGDSRITLSPSTQVVDFDAVTIYRVPEPTDRSDEHRGLDKVDPSPALSHWTMPIMNAIVGDSPEAIRTASVQGFVYISEINKDRRKISMLIPESGRDQHKPLLMATWPEPFLNLIG